MSTFEVAKRILKSVTEMMLDSWIEACEKRMDGKRVSWCRKTPAHSDRADPNQAIGRPKRYETMELLLGRFLMPGHFCLISPRNAMKP